MNLSDFDFTLPDALIATQPANPRDSSRLLVIGKKFEDKIYRDLPSLLQPNDLLVFNNSKVIPARLFAHHNGREFEILLHQKKALNIWTAFIRGSKKLRVGDCLSCHSRARREDPNFLSLDSRIKSENDDLLFTIINKHENGEIELQLSDESLIEKYGHMPLPPYIKRKDNDSDKTTYQTVYAQAEGSVAAPTAGLHFTDELLAKIPNKAFVTLHVGAGTFQPVKTENITEHQMHHEWYEISAETEAAIASCKAAGGRVIAVGTTSARVLEASEGKAGSGETNIFIYPGYEFKVVDAMLTNFHLPKSSLFMLVSALAGVEKMQAAYAYAIAEKYRFYSYGDACFIC